MPKTCSCVLVQSHFSPFKVQIHSFCTDLDNSWDIGLLFLVFFWFPFMVNTCSRSGVQKSILLTVTHLVVFHRITEVPCCNITVLSPNKTHHRTVGNLFLLNLNSFYLFISFQWHDPWTEWYFPLKSTKFWSSNSYWPSYKNHDPITPYSESQKPYCRTDAQGWQATTYFPGR